MGDKRMEIQKTIIFLLLAATCFGGSEQELPGDLKLTGDVAKLWFYSGTNWLTIAASASQVADTDYTLPPAFPVSGGQALLSSTGGVMSWGTPSTAASHDLLGPVHDDTDTDVVTRGSVIVGNSTPEWDELAIGTANFALVSDGTDISWGDKYLRNDAADTTTGVLTVEGLGTGGQTDYDLKVGDVDGSPTYGMIQIGDACIGRTSFKAGNIDLDGTIIYRNISGPVTSEIEHVFVESTGDSTRFALPKSAAGNATYNSRSMFLAGPAPADTDYVKVSYWQTNNNIFDNLACDTSGTGADLGVQNDLEVEGDIFIDSIKESTPGAGITLNHVAPGVFPTASNHLATKEYVDSSVTFISEYFFTDTASDIAGIYFKMLDTPTGGALSTHTSGSLGVGDDQALFNFATDAGVPGVMSLDAGIYGGHIHALKSGAGQKPVAIHFEIYSRATDTTETLVVTSEESSALTTGEVEYDLHATLTSDVTIDVTDRLVIKWLANVDSGGSDATVLLRQEGTTAAHLEVPITTDVLNQVFLRQDGTKELLANWDAGAFDIRAQTGTFDSLTTGGVPIVSTNGLLVDDSDLTFSTDTLTATKIGAFEAAGAINFANQNMTNVNMNSGAIDDVPIGINSEAVGIFSTLEATGDSQLEGNVSVGAAANGEFRTGGSVSITGEYLDVSGTGLTRRLLQGTVPVFSIIDTDGGDDEKMLSLAMVGGEFRWLIAEDSDVSTRITPLAMDMFDGSCTWLAEATFSDDVVVNDRISSATVIVTDAGPTNNLDVSDLNGIFLDPSDNNVTIGGFVNGVDGQVLYITVIDTTNDATLEDQEGGGSQDIFLNGGADQTVNNSINGWVLLCNGTSWFQVKGI